MQKQNCVFCEIKNENRGRILYEDEEVIGFDDINKCSAKQHILVCPKRHIKNINYLRKEDVSLVMKLKRVGLELVRECQEDREWCKKNGELCKENGEQLQYKMGFHIPPFYSINHLHLHVYQLPISNCYYRFITAGLILRSVDSLITNLQS